MDLWRRGQPTTISKTVTSNQSFNDLPGEVTKPQQILPYKASLRGDPVYLLRPRRLKLIYYWNYQPEAHFPATSVCVES